MKPRRILVTGATGFIGKAVCKEILACKQFEVLAFSRAKEADHQDLKGASWCQVDLNDPSSYVDAIRKFQPEVVLHLAWQDIPDFSLDKSILNLKNSINLLSSVLSLGSCSKVMVSGSCFELVSPTGKCSSLNEGGVKDSFTWAKQSLRSWVDMEVKKRGFSYAWFRIFYVYGPGQRTASLLPTIIRACKEGKSPTLRSPFDANDYIFIDDVARAFLAGISKKLPDGILNIGSGSSIKNIDVSKIVEKIVSEGGNPMQGGNQSIYTPVEFSSNFFADISDTRKYLNWLPQVSIEDGIKKMLNL